MGGVRYIPDADIGRSSYIRLPSSSSRWLILSGRLCSLKTRAANKRRPRPQKVPQEQPGRKWAMTESAMSRQLASASLPRRSLPSSCHSFRYALDLE